MKRVGVPSENVLTCGRAEKLPGAGGWGCKLLRDPRGYCGEPCMVTDGAICKRLQRELNKEWEP